MDFETIKFGVVGFSKNLFDKKTAYQIIDAFYQGLKEQYPDKIIEIVSGYTNSGIPKIAYELADKHGFVTVGFSAHQALTVRSGIYPCAKVILEGELFGDESEAFIEYIDSLLRVGGGPQSRKETELFKAKVSDKTEQRVFEYEVEWFG